MHGFNPDHSPENPAAEARFKQIQLAYETLAGRRKRGRAKPAAFSHGNYPPSFFKNEHPFLSFYWVMKTHGDRKIKNMKSNKQGDKEKKDDRKQPPNMAK
jgi:DnaJ-class molecular chaperone